MGLREGGGEEVNGLGLAGRAATGRQLVSRTWHSADYRYWRKILRQLVLELSRPFPSPLQVQQHLDALLPAAAAPPAPAEPAPAPAEGAMETDELLPSLAASAAASASAAAAAPPLSEADQKLHSKLVKVKDILSGKIPIGLYLDFLYR